MAPQKKNNLNNNETTTGQAIPNEPREQYVKLLQDYRSDSTLTYEKLVQNVVQNPDLGLQYDREVVLQAQKSNEMPLGQIANTVSQGPYVQNLLSSNKQQNVTSYLAQIQKSYTASPDVESLQSSKQPQPQGAIASTSGADLGVGLDVVSAQKSSRSAEDYALGIVQMLDQRRINVDRFQIDVNGETIFKMRDGNIDSHKTSINNEHTELIKKALNDPASLHGTVKITQGNQVLLHVHDGRVLIDSAGLTKQSALIEVKTPDSPNEVLYERFSKEVNGNGLQATKNIAANALKAGVKQEQIIEMLKTYDPSYQKLAQAQGENIATQTIGKIVNAADVKLMPEKMQQQQENQPLKVAKSAKL